jgi:TolB-like protein/DNA-binding winged helix-turn-helix (wHTH) protein/Tfp pilus assembly protein PilF
MNTRPQQSYVFGPFRLDTAEHSLRRDGQAVPLTPKVFDLLEVLVRNNGRLVEKEELIKEVWPDSFVEEGNLNRNISILRKVLGEDSSDGPYIETVPKRGYRFVASVKEVTGKGSGIADTGVLPTGPETALRSRKSFSARHWVILSGFVASALGVMILILSPSQRNGAARPEIKSLAVLPFQNLSGDPNQEYFTDGMTEALISSLAQIGALRIVSRTSVMTFKKNTKPLPEIAQELKVDGVIEGSVQRENGRVKVMIQLIHGPTDRHLWARNYEREMTDVLNLQSEMARAIADEIRIQVTPEERARMESTAAVNPAAHQEYLLGRFHLWKFIIDDHKRAIDHFERAIQIDPGYAPAYAGLSMAWQTLGVQSGLKNVKGEARTAAQKALELDDRLAEAYVALGRLQLFNDWDWKGGENSIKRALELDPHNLDAHFNYSLLLLALARFPEAIAEIQTAEELDPLSHQVQVAFGRILIHAGKPDEAIPRLNRAIELEPRSSQAHVRLGQAYVQMGKYDKALASYDKARVLRGNPPDHPLYRAIVAQIYARMGKYNEAKHMLKGLKDLPRSDIGASAYSALGDKDEGFRLLFKMVKEREEGNVFIKTDPQFASLHSDPRWGELLNRMNLPME